MASVTHFRPTRLAGVLACALLPVLLLGPAAAQTSDPRYDPASAAGLSLRLNTLEEQVRQLNGQIEQLSFQIRQLQDQLRRASEDSEYRFQQLGQGGGARSTASVQPHVMQPQATQPQVMQPSGAAGPGSQPQTLGQLPGRPLDLSAALGQPVPDPRYPQEQPLGTQPGFGQPVGQAGQQNTQLVLAPTGDPKDAYDLSYGYILRGEFDVAEASFRQFLTQFPNDPLAGNAQYWLGESLFARGLYRDAADAFLTGYSTYPEGAKAPDSLYKLGMSLKELGQAEAACSTFAEIPRRYPRASQAVLERARSEMQKSGC